ncbi:hypothetical protein S40288_03637 [Stachybotrys chartarum IBT 40288]|nr:hypothetical protein S40288_03637 [Stachybotrys chartarum IBT 40288]
MYSPIEDRGTYEYQPLDPGHVRILHLQPGEHNDSVFIEITHEALEKGPVNPYRALSWEWGKEPENEYIRVKNKDANGSGRREDVMEDGAYKTDTLRVKPNLLAALKHLRSTNRIKRLWVDAISIDQIELARTDAEKEGKNDEKSNQISMMTKIFGLAEEVSVWLGEERDNSDKAIEFVEALLNLDDSNHITGLERSTFDDSTRLTQSLEPLIALLKRGWFSRRWVVQEIAMAKRATVYCGKASISWDQLADAVALLEKVSRDGTINRAFKKVSSTNHVPEYIGKISSLPAYRLVQTTTRMFRGHGDDRGTRSWRFTLEELVSYLAAFRAARLHDTIYAVLGMASDFEPVRGRPLEVSTPPSHLIRKDTMGNWGKGGKEPFVVDYEKDPLLVFKEFLAHAIANSKSLDILNRPWAPNYGIDSKGERQKIDLPSWIASLSRKPFQATSDQRMVRFNPDPLCGPASFRQKLYTASLKEPATCLIDPTSNSPYMTVRGFELTTIDETFDSSFLGNVPPEWLEAGGWEEDARGEIPLPPQALWRTLVADRNSVGEDPDRWYPLVFQSVAKDRGLSYGFESYRLIHESTNAAVPELFRRVEAVVWNRRLIRTRGGYTEWISPKHIHKRPRMAVNGADHTSQSGRGLGLAPRGARAGDKVYIIFGCSVPLVLRKKTAETHLNGYYKHRDVGLGIVDEARGADPGSVTSVLDDALSRSPDPVEDGVDEPPATNKETYTVIGEAYIDHMMDGQAMAYFTERVRSARNFTLE